MIIIRRSGVMVEIKLKRWGGWENAERLIMWSMYLMTLKEIVA